MKNTKSYRAIVWRRFKKSKTAIFGMIVIILLFTTSVFAPFLAMYDPNELRMDESYTSPSIAHPFGTDEFGRDLLSRIIFGSRIVVVVAVSATLFASILGITLGLLAGYFGGFLDTLISRIIEIQLAFPGFLLAIVLVAIFGTKTMNIIMVIGFTRIPRFARLIRSSTLSISENKYVTSAKAIGASSFRIIFLHILPNCIGPILTYATLTMGASILTVAGLSFLGLGIQPPTSDWGVMLTRAREYLFVAQWMAFYPGIAIFITVMGFNLMGDGLRDALDPKGR